MCSNEFNPFRGRRYYLHFMFLNWITRNARLQQLSCTVPFWRMAELTRYALWMLEHCFFIILLRHLASPTDKDGIWVSTNHFSPCALFLHHPSILPSYHLHLPPPPPALFPSSPSFSSAQPRQQKRKK